MSISTERQGSSSTRTSPTERSSSTSSQAGGRGSSVLAASPSAIDGLAPGAVDITKIRPRLTASDQNDLLFIEREIRKPHDFDYSKTRALDLSIIETLAANTLSMLREYDADHPVITGDDLADSLQRLASLFGVGVPDRMGVELYAVALSSMPRSLLLPATIKVATSHKYPTLPLPADLLRAVEDEMKIMKRERSRIASAYSKVRGEMSERMKDAAFESQGVGLSDFDKRRAGVQDPEKLAQIMAFDAETKANIGQLWTDPDKQETALTV